MSTEKYIEEVLEKFEKNFRKDKFWGVGFNELKVKDFLIISIKEALESRDEEWKESIPEVPTMKWEMDLGSTSYQAGWIGCLKKLEENLKDKHLIK